MKQFSLYVILLFSLASCKKIVQVDTSAAPPQIVIEGKITDGFEDQVVTISKSINYDDTGEYPRLTGAAVKVTDNKGNVYKFLETSAGSYHHKMQGVSGRTYALSVNLQGQTYSATSTMPNPVKLDSIGVITNNFFNKERINPIIYFTDPKEEINFYHFNLFVNSKISKRTYASSDRLTNGNTTQIQFFYDDGDNEKLIAGDKISVEMECVDKAIYNYWYALVQQAGNGPNQGATPSNPTSNISNGALGYFSANTYQEVTVTIK
ncbi:hypothetical protein ABIB40_003093 [Pedobacter sp. UYP30]|uniref:DUF4249 domain-containing protein n=1 Tax=Pedobacter sp. UYP30 TaxID=1756400 RepID=UPI00339438EE